MSRHDDFDKFCGDAIYDAWRSGMNPDRVDCDRCREHYDAGNEPEAVVRELQRQDEHRREERDAEENARLEAEYWAEVERQEAEELKAAIRAASKHKLET